MTSFLVTAGTPSVANASQASLISMIVTRGAVTAFVAVAGFLVGSFLNVVIYRVPRGLSVVEPRSFCPHCDTPVRPIDNVPVLSWLALRGRCHHCHGPISMRYPLVELGTGVVFAAVGWGLGPHWAVAGACVLAATLIALVAIELDGLALPLSVAAIGTGIGAAMLVGAGVADRRWAHVAGVVVGLAVAGAGLVMARVGGPDHPSWTATAPVLLPVGVALGWLGPVYAGAGLGTTGVLVLAATGIRRRRDASKEHPVRGVWGVPLVVGVVVATVIAVGLGTGVGY
jgi:leader peptidase (prepilin peptidase) / N-methyltransferase